MATERLTRFAWFVVGVNVLVILWGAVVRATGSGAGCGSHWPDCNGRVVPLSPSADTLIEFTHRLTSGVALVLVAALVAWVFRRHPAGSSVRKGAVAALVFIAVEALIGAGLVLFELVADNDSVARAVVIAFHLANTLFLLAALVLTAWWSAGGGTPRLRRDRLTAGLAGGLAVVLLLAMSGAVTALGDTLFPAGTLAEGLRADVAPGAHILLRLRVWHPLLAIVGGVYLLVVASAVARRRPRASRRAGLVRGFVLLELGVGAVNLALLAPVWMQVTHLLVADLLWIALVLLTAEALSDEIEAPADLRTAAAVLD